MILQKNQLKDHYYLVPLTNLQYDGADYDRDRTEVNKTDKVIYHCFNGMRSKTDLSFATQARRV